MTVLELKEILKDLPDDAKVIVYDGSDSSGEILSHWTSDDGFYVAELILSTD